MLLSLVNCIGYWSESLYDFSVDEHATTLSAAKLSGSSKWLLVVARKHYFETVKDYPVGSLSDLRGILRNEPWRYPFKGKLLLRIERLSDHSHRVTSWVIKQGVIDGLILNSWFVVPESACVHALESGKITSLDRLGSPLFISLTANGLASIEGRESMFSRHVNTHSGDNSEKNISLNRLTESDSVGRILIGALSAVKQSPLGFYNGPTIYNVTSTTVSRWLKVLVSAVVVYLGAASIFIALLGYYQERDLREMSPSSEAVLKLRSAALEKKRALNSIDEALASRGQISAGWDLFIDLKAKGVIFSSVQTNSSIIEFSCSHMDATEILQYLKNDPRVADAEFSSAIQKEQGLDGFSVRIKLAMVNYNNPLRDVLSRAGQQGDVTDDLRVHDRLQVKSGQL